VAERAVGVVATVTRMASSLQGTTGADDACVSKSSSRRTDTTGETSFAECQKVCRVLYVGHSANLYFAECHARQKNTW
jgi:hypothetical protein